MCGFFVSKFYFIKIYPRRKSARSAHLSTCLLLFPSPLICVCVCGRRPHDHEQAGSNCRDPASLTSVSFLLALSPLAAEHDVFRTQQFPVSRGHWMSACTLRKCSHQTRVPAVVHTTQLLSMGQHAIGWDVRVYHFARLTRYYILSLAGLQCVCCGGGGGGFLCLLFLVQCLGLQNSLRNIYLFLKASRF